MLGSRRFFCNMPTASERAFKTIELLESILILSTPLELLHTPAVCKHWQKVFNNSSTLQAICFLNPAKKDTIWLVDCLNFPYAPGTIYEKFYDTQVHVKSAINPSSAELKAHHDCNSRQAESALCTSSSLSRRRMLRECGSQILHAYCSRLRAVETGLTETLLSQLVAGYASHSTAGETH